MKSMWQQTAVLILGGGLALTCGLWTAHRGWQRLQAPQELTQTQRTLEAMGGSEGLASRRQSLIGIRQRLELERDAKASSGAVFSQRLEDIFGQMDLRLHGSTSWQAVPGLDMPGAMAFERRFTGVGSWQGLLDAVHSLESWPDQSRIRSLTLTIPTLDGAAPSQEAPPHLEVAFDLEVSVIRRHSVGSSEEVTSDAS